jgi:putative (di)nucleoside polyphosphate hydrolase
VENVVNFKRDVYVRALHHLAPYARTVAGDGAIPQVERPPMAVPMRAAAGRGRP